MEIRLAAPLQADSIVDGEGFRTVLWTQGCPHHCVGCHNPETHSLDGGYITTTEELQEELSSIRYQDGITFSGGDPIVQAEACSQLASFVKSMGWNVWCYSGYTFEELLVLAESNPFVLTFLENTDVLVDGKFQLELRSLDLHFKGSSNQRVIDVPKSLKMGKVILIPQFACVKSYTNLHEKPKCIYV